ncbi:MAG: hypothetical protein AABX66_02375, partial [Nanoarchaeota archaeon]
MINKKGIEFSFNWIFSIVVGIVVIFLAIYAANSFIKTERTLQDTETVQQLQTLLNPLQTSIESTTKPSNIIFPREVKLMTQCIASTGMGEQKITLSSKNNIGGEWSSVSFSNKISSYLFMESTVQGKQMHVLVAPFYMPYKVADLVILWSTNYCLVNAPQNVKDELQILNASGVIFADSKLKCSSNSNKVCFLNSPSDIDEGCEIKVNTYLKQVRSTGKLVYYEGSLLYASIFSNADIYECNVKRLASRTKELANLYSQKSILLGDKSNCGGALAPILNNYANIVSI